MVIQEASIFRRTEEKHKENAFLDAEKMAVSDGIPLVLKPSIHIRWFRSSSDFFMLGLLIALVNSAFVNLLHINLVIILGYVALAALTYNLHLVMSAISTAHAGIVRFVIAFL